MGPRLCSRGNGAGAFGRRAAATASMGPRLCSRGNVASVVHPAHPRASMGPRLCSRGNRRPHEPDAAIGEQLQWGRGSVAAEMGATSRRIHDDSASMGPRLCSRGMCWADRLGSPAASMGPRLCSRGNQRRCSGSTRCDVLQWGRGSVAAEMRPDCRSSQSLSLLQWGRGSVAAEMRPAACREAIIAASMGPRLCSRGNRRLRNGDPTRAHVLQWGRGSVAAEI